jgi:lipid II:glycine glycyltransferase (peptidoglycan interpeptide bridge formation enzyme)
VTGDPEAWDAFVAASPQATYLQATAWARVKAPNGWTAEHIETTDAPRVGAQVLVRRPGRSPWSFAYAPRGPIAADWSSPEATVAAWTRAVRDHRWRARTATLRIEPEIEHDGPLDTHGAMRAALTSHGWRRASAIQPTTSRLVDLGADEAGLWADLRKKWRQYVSKARTGGVTVTDAGEERMADFHRIMVETSGRTATPIRTADAFRDIYVAFRDRGGSRLLFATGPDGDAQAALLLVRFGTRVVEPYGGMTAAGAESRANYLLKWEAIRTSREAGATSYDMWGLVTPGIRQFKEGFGGREVRYVGAWDLAIDRIGALAYRLGERVLATRRDGAADA